MSELKGDLTSIYKGFYCKMLHNHFEAQNYELKCIKVNDPLCLCLKFIALSTHYYTTKSIMSYCHSVLLIMCRRSSLLLSGQSFFPTAAIQQTDANTFLIV